MGGFGQVIESELQRWGKLIRKARIKIERQLRLRQAYESSNRHSRKRVGG